MGTTIPSLTESQFRDWMSRDSPLPLSNASLTALYTHYTELQRWSLRLSLVGPGTARDVLARHYAESLAATPLISPQDRSLVDIGTGAGFPGFVLAAAMASLEVTLVEPREKKWAFLKTVVRRSGLSCHCLNVRVERPLSKELPQEIDIVTSRALVIPPTLIETLQETSPGLRFLFWCGREQPVLPALCRVERQISIEGSRYRRILEVRRS